MLHQLTCRTFKRDNSMTDTTYTIPATADIGHVHLNVSNLNRALTFYCGVLGFTLVTRLGDGAAFVAAGNYHHHIGLNTWHTANASPAPDGHTGLYHLAVRYPSRPDLAHAVQRVLNARIPIHGATDHGVSESVYLADPDGNGIELTCDRPISEWPRNARGEPQMFAGKALDIAALLGVGLQ